MIAKNQYVKIQFKDKTKGKTKKGYDELWNAHIAFDEFSKDYVLTILLANNEVKCVRRYPQSVIHSIEYNPTSVV